MTSSTGSSARGSAAGSTSAHATAASTGGSTGAAAGGSATGASTTGRSPTAAAGTTGVPTSASATSGSTTTGLSTTTGSSTTSGSTAGAGTTGAGTTGAGPQAWLWVWYDYANSLNAVSQSAASFTHVSPALYQMNYAYASGVPEFWLDDSSVGTWPAGTDSFDGLTSAQIAQKVHAMGLKVIPLIFGGAANNGTDQGIQNVIEDSPPGTRAAFIGALVSEAQAKGYDGWNLDWESNLQDSPDGPLLLSFLSAAHAAFAAAGLSLSLDVISSNVLETYCSGGTGFVELANLGPVVDAVVLEAYDNLLGSPGTACPAGVPNPQPCDLTPPGARTLADDLALVCTDVPAAKVILGLDSIPADTNPIAGAALSAAESYGYNKVAVWPDYNTDGPGGTYLLLDPSGLSPPGSSWDGLLHGFLSFWGG